MQNNANNAKYLYFHTVRLNLSWKIKCTCTILYMLGLAGLSKFNITDSIYHKNIQKSGQQNRIAIVIKVNK